MNTTLLDRTLGDLAVAIPGATAVFRKFKLDFCCGGDVPLAQAASARRLDVDMIATELGTLATVPIDTTIPAKTVELIDHILRRYHETHRRELPELVSLARKVETVHARHPKVPHGLADFLQHMLDELEVHMKKEELILFPAMTNRPDMPLDGPIFQMRHEHDEHGENLRRLEVLTNDFTLPEDACRTWQALYAGSAKLTEDLMEHIHLENNMLFPKFARNT